MHKPLGFAIKNRFGFPLHQLDDVRATVIPKTFPCEFKWTVSLGFLSVCLCMPGEWIVGRGLCVSFRGHALICMFWIIATSLVSVTLSILCSLGTRVAFWIRSVRMMSTGKVTLQVWSFGCRKWALILQIGLSIWVAQTGREFQRSWKTLTHLLLGSWVNLPTRTANRIFAIVILGQCAQLWDRVLFGEITPAPCFIMKSLEEIVSANSSSSEITYFAQDSLLPCFSSSSFPHSTKQEGTKQTLLLRHNCLKTGLEVCHRRNYKGAKPKPRYKNCQSMGHCVCEEVSTGEQATGPRAPPLMCKESSVKRPYMRNVRFSITMVVININ